MISRRSARVILPVFAVIALLMVGQAQAPSPVATATVTARLLLDQPGPVVNRNIYGQFAEHLGRGIYEGLWVGPESPIPNTRGIRNDVVAALKTLNLPVLRWPGGCFADEYHWRDGIGPREQRPKMINTHWGGVVEDNGFGTHEFLDLCEQVGAEPYICLNVGSGTVREAAEWVEYVTSDARSPMTELRKRNGREKPWKAKYWAVGNESWGCGGNMTPEFYSNLFKQFGTFVRGGGLYRVASGGTDPDLDWTRTVMESTRNHRDLIQGYSFHYYTFCHGWDHKSSATRFNENDWFNTMSKTVLMQDRLEAHMRIMDESDPGNTVGLIADEWGNWYDVEPGTNPAFLFQQNTLRDAVTAALYLNIYNNHCGRVKMANLAQAVNVLQSVLLTRGSEMVRTPTYYVFKMFKVHQDAVMLPVNVRCEPYVHEGSSIPSITASASREGGEKIHVSLANLDPTNGHEVACDLRGTGDKLRVSAQILTAETMNAFNDFGKPENVKPVDFSDFKISGQTVVVRMPAKSVVVLEVK
jgi:alpha-L-arabinofuranosidase